VFCLQVVMNLLTLGL